MSFKVLTASWQFTASRQQFEVITLDVESEIVIYFCIFKYKPYLS